MAAEPLIDAVSNGGAKGIDMVAVKEIVTFHKPALLVVYQEGQSNIVGAVADVLGQPWTTVGGIDEVARIPSETVAGIEVGNIGPQTPPQRLARTVILAHCVDAGQVINDSLRDQCDFEYLYTQKPFFRRDIARFLSLVLGQIPPHQDLEKKERTLLLSTTFPDVRAALPNLDILSVGADAVELRVDLLEEPRADGSHSAVPSLKYVAEQLLLLRQRTELPIIFTTRCTKENGRFPMDDPLLFFKYLRKAIQWGCEYIDVELWLPEEMRRELAEVKGHSKIISAFHDFSGAFKWTAPETEELFRQGAVYGDVVKMIAFVNSMQENYELEYFRSTIQSKYSHPPFSGLNMGPMGHLSRTLNKVFTPITHPLLPLIAAPGQLSAAEINTALHNMGHMPRVDIYGIGGTRSSSQAMFFEKCFNELSLPHQLKVVQKSPNSSLEVLMKQPHFGGAYLNPPLASSSVPRLSGLSEAAQAIGQVDTVLVRGDGNEATFVGHNAAWKGLRETLTRDFVPAAYGRRAALILASAESDAAASAYALKSLGIGPIYTVGFKARGPLATEVQPVRGIEDLQELATPFVIISALPAEKSLLVGPLLKHYSAVKNGSGAEAGKVFVDLSNGPRKGDPSTVAAELGWTAYGAADVNAWTIVETLRLLVGQNVPFDFVRLASGRSLY